MPKWSGLVLQTKTREDSSPAKAHVSGRTFRFGSRDEVQLSRRRMREASVRDEAPRHEVETAVRHNDILRQRSSSSGRSLGNTSPWYRRRTPAGIGTRRLVALFEQHY